ncbi:MAG: outer membrane lipoprotein-sorting protein [Gammaproteobacteria bacterium]|nr:outer membrane lipoprotein-sorting protein [Gammaproteobacteria bacterium]NIN62629.1 outer membrane lipoprotein-sorting protein [Gammaproteobacteria bacterium]NIO63166.1 outer membrane lipoprotein-sorting protein [Gammaproteobacteria bacterium]NIQ11336.1 outer membrane lipoprotein-sorting protein [Gammaproteobacteria bacterium]NIQ20267.1 outer membrane lipoprotein-sorting protein [Gammaproteobacteria bacterium]
MLKWLYIILPLILLSPEITAGETPEEKGLAIAIEAERRDTGWKNQLSDMEMILRNKQGEESKRTLNIKTLEVENDGDKSLTVFDNPRDIKGTAFLSYTHALEPDDQWLYLPALKRVKRISSTNKSGPFVGSEFAYEDLSSQEVEKYSYKWLRDETLNGKETFVIERYPAYEYSGYTRQIVWIDKSIYQPLKVEYYDRKNALLKTLTISNYRQYIDKFWRSDSMLMVNYQTGKETLLNWKNYQFNNDLDERDFDLNTLKRSR